MKKLFTTVSLVILMFTGFAQGLVNFFNSATTLVSNDYPSGPISGPVSSYYFGLLIAPAGSTDPSAFTFSGVYGTNLATAGRFSGGQQVAVPGWQAGVAKSFMVAGWSADLGHDWNPSWLGTFTHGVGFSQIAQGTAGGFDGVGTLPTLPIFSSFTINSGFNINHCLGPYFYESDFLIYPSSLLTVNAGTNVAFYASTRACPPPSFYQWYSNGVAIPGATTNPYQITNVQPLQAGNYHVVVSSPYWGVHQSHPATLTVLSQPIITTQPQSQSNVVGSTLELRVEAVGPPPLSYQWLFNDDVYTGRRTTLGLSSGYSFGWQADGLLASAALNQFGAAAYGYSTAGLLNTRTVGQRVTATSARDGLGRPLSINTTISGLSKLTEALTWTGDGLLNTHTLGRAGDFTNAQAFFYANSSRRLIEERLNLDATKRWTNFYTFDGGSASGPGVLTQIGQTPSTGQWSGVTDAFARVNRETNTIAKQLAYGRVNGPAAITALLDGVPQPVTILGTGNSQWTNQWRTTLEMSPGAHQLSVTAAHPSGQYNTNVVNWFTNSLGSLTVTNVLDAVGNLTQRIWRKANGNTNLVQTLTWDARGRLTKVTERDSNTNGRNFSVVYDALGRRLQTTEVVVTNNIALTNQPIVVSHYFDPLVEFLELGVTDNGKTTWKLMGPDMDGVYGGQNGTGGFEGEASGLTFSTLLSDSLGNIHGSYDTSLKWNTSRVGGYGGVTGYRPLTLGSVGDLSSKYTWRNRATDAIGLAWMGGNWLDPQSGSFISFDPLGHNASDSGYSFCSGNPYGFWDADGRLHKKIRNTWRDIHGDDDDKHDLALNNLSQGFQVNIPRAIDETIASPVSLMDWVVQKSIPPEERPLSGLGSGNLTRFVENNVQERTERAIRNGADPNADAYQITLPASRGIVMAGTIVVPGLAEAKAVEIPERVAVRTALVEVRTAENSILGLTRGARVKIRIRAGDFTAEERALIRARYEVANARIGAGAETATVGNQVDYVRDLSRRYVRDVLGLYPPNTPLSKVRIPQGFNVDEFVSRQFGGRQVPANQNLLPARINSALGPLEEKAVRKLPDGTIIQGFDIEFY